MNQNETKKLDANITKFYLFIVPWTFWLVSAISVVFYRRNNLSITQISMIDAVWAVAAFLLEIPTGVLSDRWSRKYMLFFSSLFAATGFLIFYLSSDIWPFIFATILMASRWTFFSGTANALLYDTLIVLGRETEFEKILGRRKFLGMLGVSIAGVIGSYIAQFNIRLPYLLSFFASFAAALVALTFIEPKVHTSSDEIKLWDHIKNSGKAVLAEPTVRFLMIFIIVMSYPDNYLDEYDQLYLTAIGMPLAWFGLWIALRRGLQGGANAFAEKIKRFNTVDYKKLSLFIIVIGLGFIVWGNKYLGLASFLVVFSVLGITDVLAWGEIHHQTKSSQRATVESLVSFFTTIVAIPSLILFGKISDMWGIRAGYAMIFVIVTAYLTYYLLNSSNRKMIATPLGD